MGGVMSESRARVAGELPRWDLSNVYPGLDSELFRADGERLKSDIAVAEAYLAAELPKAGVEAGPQRVADVLDNMVRG